ncbi:unnamed protein product [Heligmosomoides polygyrus]|uniref:G_PROTEIN_RECEP_F1_2 domain-containing protein n=1 Tax=Heligmosomoides polygyrus TaxID=6339 RepID=A0A3P8C9D1_HELPZ|nr:unnamed protein product [Heligmosomoides polygyrus]
MRQYLFSYHSTYVRNWRVLGAIWVLSALSTTVLQFLVLVHPAWIGNEEGGYLGLYNYCSTIECPWNMFEIRTLTAAFELSALLVFLAAILSSLAVFSILVSSEALNRCFLSILFFTVFSLLAGCLLFPYGWDHERVREICESKRYNLGLCQLRWPYLLALILVVDQMTLAVLGFALTLKRPPKLPEFSVKTISHPVPRPRKLSLQESYYSNSASRLDL